MSSESEIREKLSDHESIQKTTIYVSIVAFLSLYFILLRCFNAAGLRRFQSPTKDGVARLVTLAISSLHSVITTLAALYIMVTDNLWEDPVGVTNLRTHILCCFQVGYFVSDIIFSITIRREFSHGISMICHHFLAATGFFVVAHFQVFGFYACFRSLSEFSTPFVNMRGILLIHGMDGGLLYRTNAIIAIVAFLIARILPIPYLYKTMLHSWNELMRFPSTLVCLFAIINVSLDVINILWMYRLLKLLINFLRSKGKKNE